MGNNELLELRKRVEKRSRAALKEANLVPGVIYGNGVEDSVAVEMNASDLNDVLKKNAKTAVIPVNFDGNKISIIVKEIQKDALSPRITHIDFQSVKKDEILEMNLPILVEGEEDVAHRKLLLNTVLTEVLVKGPADLIPDNVKVNVEGLKIDDKITVADLKLPEKIEMITDKDEIVLTITVSKTSQEVEESEEASAEPAVIGEEKAE